MRLQPGGRPERGHVARPERRLALQKAPLRGGLRRRRQVGELEARAARDLVEVAREKAERRLVLGVPLLPEDRLRRELDVHDAVRADERLEPRALVRRQVGRLRVQLRRVAVARDVLEARQLALDAHERLVELLAQVLALARRAEVPRHRHERLDDLLRARAREGDGVERVRRAELVGAHGVPDRREHGDGRLHAVLREVGLERLARLLARARHDVGVPPLLRRRVRQRMQDARVEEGLVHADGVARERELLLARRRKRHAADEVDLAVPHRRDGVVEGREDVVDDPAVERRDAVQVFGHVAAHLALRAELDETGLEVGRDAHEVARHNLAEDVVPRLVEPGALVDLQLAEVVLERGAERGLVLAHGEVGPARPDVRDARHVRRRRPDRREQQVALPREDGVLRLQDVVEGAELGRHLAAPGPVVEVRLRVEDARDVGDAQVLRPARRQHGVELRRAVLRRGELDARVGDRLVDERVGVRDGRQPEDGRQDVHLELREVRGIRRVEALELLDLDVVRLGETLEDAHAEVGVAEDGAPRLAGAHGDAQLLVRQVVAAQVRRRGRARVRVRRGVRRARDLGLRDLVRRRQARLRVRPEGNGRRLASDGRDGSGQTGENAGKRLHAGNFPSRTSET